MNNGEQLMFLSTDSMLKIIIHFATNPGSATQEIIEIIQDYSLQFDESDFLDDPRIEKELAETIDNTFRTFPEENEMDEYAQILKSYSNELDLLTGKGSRLGILIRTTFLQSLSDFHILG